jgi:hypothetical protein
MLYLWVGVFWTNIATEIPNDKLTKVVIKLFKPHNHHSLYHEGAVERNREYNGYVSTFLFNYIYQYYFCDLWYCFLIVFYHNGNKDGF